MACVIKFDDHQAVKADQDSKVNYLEGLVKAAKAFTDFSGKNTLILFIEVIEIVLPLNS